MESEAMIIEASMSEKIENSDYIIEGEISSSKGRYDSKLQMPVTDYTITITNNFTATKTEEKIVFTALGGELGKMRVKVNPSEEYTVGSYGIFFLKNNPQGFTTIHKT
jgi:hypothetical protein